MALSLMVPAAWAEPADEPASATYEAVLGKTARKYGNIELDISTEEFMKAGFAYGDVVTVDVNGNSYEMPVCSNYNDVDTDKKLVRATEGASSVIVAINYGQLAVDAGLAKPNTDPAVSDKYVAADGVTYPVKVTITMKDKGAYYDEWDARQLPQRTGDRNADMYKNLTDAEFANVRVIETTGMGEGVLYRGSSPINDAVEGRNPYADAAAKAAGIKTFINLADSEAAAKAYPGWEGSYYSTQDAVFLNMPVAFTTDAFKTGLANGYRYIASSETEAPYYMHCTEGKDRCGIASAVLECFMGASYDEVVADYLVTYYNYYGIQPGTEKAANIAKYGIVSCAADHVRRGGSVEGRPAGRGAGLSAGDRPERRGDRLPPADAQRPAPPPSRGWSSSCTPMTYTAISWAIPRWPRCATRLSPSAPRSFWPTPATTVRAHPMSAPRRAPTPPR